MELVRLKMKIKNAQIVCPRLHKLKVIKIPNSELKVLFCKKCKQYYPLTMDVEDNKGVKKNE